MAGYRALGWKTPTASDPKTTLTLIAVFFLGVATFVVQRCYNTVVDSHKKHYKAGQNFRTAPYIIIHPYMGLYYSVYHQ